MKIPNVNFGIQNLDIEEVKTFWVNQHQEGSQVPGHIFNILAEIGAIKSHAVALLNQGNNSNVDLNVL